MLVQPTDTLKISAIALYQSLSMGDYDEYDLPPGNPSARYQPSNANEPITDKFRLFGLTVTDDLPFGQLTSATAYYSRTESQTQDTAEALYSLLPLYGITTNQYYTSPFNETDSTQQFSEELRLASTGNGPLQWIVGGFYSHFKSIFQEYNASIPIAAQIPGNLAVNPDGILYQANNPYRIDQYALFGEANYALTDRWKLTLGLRWYKFDSKADEETSGALATSGNATPLLSTFSTSNTGLNPKVTLSYEQNHDLTVYGTIARGFRPGGINQQIPNPPCTLTTETYGPDSIWNYEIGEKAKLFDNRVQLNADVYYIRWNQVQQSVNQACGYPLTENAGTATSYGPELELTASLTSELTLSVTGTYTHATITSVDSALQAQDTALTPGLGLLNVPKYTETTALTYTTPINDHLKFMAASHS